MTKISTKTPKIIKEKWWILSQSKELTNAVDALLADCILSTVKQESIVIEITWSAIVLQFQESNILLVCYSLVYYMEFQQHN